MHVGYSLDSVISQAERYDMESQLELNWSWRLLLRIHEDEDWAFMCVHFPGRVG